MKKRNRVIKKIFSSLLQSLIVLIGITFISFLILHLSPGNPAEIWLTGGDGNVARSPRRL